MRVATAPTLGLTVAACALTALVVRAVVARTDDDGLPGAEIGRAGRLGLDGLEALRKANDEGAQALSEARRGAATLLAQERARGGEAEGFAGLVVSSAPLALVDGRWVVPGGAGGEWDAAARSIGAGARTWEEGAVVWAVAEAPAGPSPEARGGSGDPDPGSGASTTTRLLVRVTGADPAPPVDIAAASSGLLALSSVSAPDRAPLSRADGAAAVVALVLAAAAAGIARRRFDVPVSGALDVVDAWRSAPAAGLTAVPGRGVAPASSPAWSSALPSAAARTARPAPSPATDGGALPIAVSDLTEGARGLRPPDDPEWHAEPSAPAGSISSGRTPEADLPVPGEPPPPAGASAPQPPPGAGPLAARDRPDALDPAPAMPPPSIPITGTPAARVIAAVLASALGEADRRYHRLADTLGPDAHRLATAVAALGEGDLASQPPLTVAPVLRPIASALVATRRALTARIGDLHGRALAAARAVVDARGASVRGREASQSLTTTLGRLGGEAGATRSTLEAHRASSHEALTTLAASADALRRATRELRGELSTLARRAHDLTATSARLRTRADQSVDVDEALDLLASIASASDAIPVAAGNSRPGSHVLATARRGRSTLAELRREADTVIADVAAVGRELAAAAEKPGPVLRDAPPAAVTVVRDVIHAHLGTAESLTDALTQLAGALDRLESTQREGAGALARLAAAAPGLTDAILGLQLDPRVDPALLVALTAPPPDPGGDPTLHAVRAAASASQARVDDLLRFLETEADRAASRA